MSNKIYYFKQIDALRALAVIMTLCVHWIPDSGLGAHVPYMQLGVDLFFTISGFLITSILLKTKASYTVPNKLIIIKNFIIRRALRLFPVYYLFLIGFVILSAITGFWLWKKGYGVYYFTYTSNILFFTKGLQSKLFNHTWSLCVEEQFYLIWPWLVIFLPLKIFKKVIVAFIITGVVCYLYYFTFVSTEPTDHFITVSNIRMLPFANFHTLGAGALLAYLWLYSRNTPIVEHIISYSKIYLLGFLMLFVFVYETEAFYSAASGIAYFTQEILLATVLFFLLLSTLTGWRSIPGKIADNEGIQYIGRISYGVYLYHKPVPFLLSLFLSKIGLNIHNSYVLILLYALITLVVSSLSYKYFESPFLRLKEKFDK